MCIAIKFTYIIVLIYKESQESIFDPLKTLYVYLYIIIFIFLKYG